MVQQLRLHGSNAGDSSPIPGQGTKVPHAVWCGPKKKKIGNPVLGTASPCSTESSHNRILKYLMNVLNCGSKCIYIHQ